MGLRVCVPGTRRIAAMSTPRSAMKLRVAAPVLLAMAAVVALGACETERKLQARKDPLAERYLNNYAAIITTLEGVVDVESASRAAPRIKALQREMDELGKRLGKFSPAYQKHFSRKYGPRFTLLREEMSAERRRIVDLPEVDIEFRAAMKAADRTS